jgi:hypothetical protein
MSRIVAGSLVVALGALGALAGCGISPPAATAIDASRAHVELADLERGRAVLVGKCGGCHRIPLPGEHHGNAWPDRLDDMAPRAHLDAVQRRLLEEYLVAMAAR